MKNVPSHRTALALFLTALCFFTEAPAKASTGSEQQAPLVRQSNTTLRMPLEPAVVGYTTTDALGGLQFTNPVAIVSPPGESNRLFVLERAGRVLIITNLAVPTQTVFLDISDRVDSDYKNRGAEGLSGLAFHPDYANNGFFYVVYTARARGAGGIASYNRLARFTVSPENPNQADKTSELLLLMQQDEGYGHNWNDLAFGPDGYLYMAAGDEGDPQDQYHNSERIDKDFFSGILRLDVDKRPGSLVPNPHPAVIGNYAVPPDNPFVDATDFMDSLVDPKNVRTELYAVGLRNPWRMSIDAVTGRIYCGDVGQQAREEVDIITKGGNYGWAYKEGTLPGFRGDPPPGTAASFINPVIEYERGYATNQGTTVVGGRVYRGANLPDLNGLYIFGDYTSGHIWALHENSDGPATMQWLASDPGLAGFGTDPRNGDILIADHDEGKIKRLEYRTDPSSLNAPPTLADTGIFSDLVSLKPQAGIVPYDINVSFWSDNARKQRWFSVPSSDQKIGFSQDGNWNFPEGTVWIKHFELELTNGVPESARRLETRVLVRNRNGIYGVTYRWGDSTSNATLVPAEGLDESFVIHDSGTIRTQVWHYPGRNECLRCHTPEGGYGLGFNTAQLNRDYDYGTGAFNQLNALSQAGYFNGALGNAHSFRALAQPGDSNQSLEYRVRSYLAANCSQCHQPGGSGGGAFDARIGTPTSQTGLIDGFLANNLGDSGNRVVKAGSVDHSMLLTRIAKADASRMPPLASNLLDQEAIKLLTDWITNDLPEGESFAQWQTRIFGSTNSVDASPQADPDHDRANNLLEYLTQTDPSNPASFWKVTITQAEGSVQIQFPHNANRSFEVETTSDPSDPNSWFPLDTVDNRPFFWATNGLSVIAEPGGSAMKFYRVRVTAP